jgi:hypothetical protein
MRFVPLAIFACLGLSGAAHAAHASRAAQAAEPETYVFDVLALQPYRGNLARLVKAKDAPDWVKAIVSQGEGTAVPSKSVDVGGTPYRLDHVCKVHDCAGNTLDILWAPRGAKVWAALVDGGKPAVMLGDPKPPQARALAAAVAVATAPIATPAAATSSATPEAAPTTPSAPPTAPLPASSPTAPTTMPAAEAPK